MAYTVTTHGYDAQGRPAPASVKVHADTDSALADVCELLSRNVPNVAIHDGDGHSISGDDLVACCLGDKRLTADLRAV